jgi:serine/threonine protein kinase
MVKGLIAMPGRTVHLNDANPVSTGGEGPFFDKPVGTGTAPIDSYDNDRDVGGHQSENILPSGQVIDRYRIIRLIASGGMARVYEAVHAFTQKQVALKVMHHRLMERRDSVERFRHEAMALSSIRHENVVNVLNAGLTDDGHVFIAMELLNGKNLRDVLRMERQPGLRESLRLICEVAEGVAAAHDIQIIHRDLKPENIFCVQGGPAKVLDLGTAKFAGTNAPTTQTALGKVIGTAAYIAPERLQGEPGDERCDIYSLGLVLYECIAGFHPLAPTGSWPSAAEIASRQVTFDPRPIPGLSSDLWNVIAKATQKKPERRFRTMREFRSALDVVAAQSQYSDSSLRQTPNKSRWFSLGFPIIAGLIAGSGSASLLFYRHHLHASTASGLPTRTVRVPPIQKEIPKSPEDLTNPPVMRSAVVSVAASPEATNSNAASAASAPEIVNLTVMKSNRVAVSGKATVRPLTDSTKVPARVRADDTKTERSNRSPSKANVGLATNSNSAGPKPSKELLPASGL